MNRLIDNWKYFGKSMSPSTDHGSGKKSDDIIKSGLAIASCSMIANVVAVGSLANAATTAIAGCTSA